MRRARTVVLGVASVVLLALLLVACGSSPTVSSDVITRSKTNSTTSAERAQKPHRRQAHTGDQSQKAFARAVTTQGDTNTPCHATVSLKDGTLKVGVVVFDPGEVVIEPYVHHGPILRRDYLHVKPPSSPVAVFHHVAAVDSIAVVEYTSDYDSHSCSVLTGTPI